MADRNVTGRVPASPALLLAVDGCDHDRLVAVAVAVGDVVAARTVRRDEAAFDRAIPTALREVLRGWRPDAVVAVVGPGSYTGVRTAMAAALGTAHALGTPLHGAGALEVVAHGAPPGTARVAAVAPAGRGGLYAAVYDLAGGHAVETSPPVRVDGATYRPPPQAVAVALGRVPDGWTGGPLHVGDPVTALAAAARSAATRPPLDPSGLHAVTLGPAVGRSTRTRV